MIQPGKKETLYGDGALCDGGFLPRVMPCLTEGGLPQRSFEDGIDGGVSTAWGNLLNRFLDLRSQGGSPGDSGRIVFEIAKDALEHWLQWDNSNREKTKSSELKDISAYVSRWGEWAQRIVVTLQAVQYLEDKRKEITLQTMNDAIRIAEWFAGEQLQIIHAARVDAADKEHAKRIDRANKLTSLLQQSQGEKTVAELGKRNNFSAKELRELSEIFPDKFKIREKPTSTKPALVCVLQ
jgi:hypothetical protein